MNYKNLFKYSLLTFICLSLIYLMLDAMSSNWMESETKKNPKVLSKKINDEKATSEVNINKIAENNYKNSANETAENKVLSNNVAEKVNKEKENETKIIAYYFHGNYRCYTCRAIESMAYKIIQDKFAAELSSGKMVWKAINVEQPENRHFIYDFQLYSSSLVIVRNDNEKTLKWKLLQDVWRLVRNENEFTKYVTDEINKMLKR